MPSRKRSQAALPEPQRYDVAVIGAGLGGLTAAARLAQAGKSVVLLERHNIPGGYSTTFVRGGWEFDVSLHALSGVGSPERPGHTRRLLEQLGVADRIEFIELPWLIRVLCEDVDVVVPADWQGFEEVLVSVSPTHSADIRSLMATIRQCFDDRYLGQESAADAALMTQYASLTLAEALDRFGLDARTSQVLLAISDYFGSSPLLQSFDSFAVGMGDYLENGAYYVRGKSQALANALLETFTQHGGKAAFNDAVVEIQVAGGRATGVTTANGARYDVDAVFSNADPLTTCSLAGAGNFSRDYLNELAALPLSLSVVAVYLAVNETADNLGLATNETIITDIDIGDDEVLVKMHGFAPGKIEVSCHDHTYPGNSPAGTSTVTLLAASYADQWLGLSPNEYFDAKRSYAEKVLDLTERYFPGLRERCIAIEVSTPITHMRYAGTRGGAIYGFEHLPGSAELGYRSPVPGLHFVGAWSSAGGFEPALISGHLAAQDYLESPEVEAPGPLPVVESDSMEVAPSGEAPTPAGHPRLSTRLRAEREFVSSVHPRSMQLRVDEIFTETPDCKTLRCRRMDGALPPYQAGQYLSLDLDIRGTLVSRPYTPSSAPERGWIDLTIVDKPGGFCAPFLLNEVSVGDVLTSGGFNGSFYYEPLIDGTDLVFVAGGDGITPFMSIIRNLLGQEHDLRVRLIYGSRTPDHEVFGDELRQIAARVPWLEVCSVYSEPGSAQQGPTGLIDAEVIRGQVPDLRSKTFFVCGPEPMYAAVTRILTELGVPRHRVRVELHGPPPDIAGQAGWPADVGVDDQFEVSVKGRAIPARAGEPLLNTLERHGLPLPARCRSGECGYCRVKVVSGETYSSPVAFPREADRSSGFVYSCCTFPLSDLEIRVD